MERRDKKNFLIGALLAIIFVMSVGFALLNSNLKFIATGTVSGDWQVKFDSTSYDELEKTDGVTDVTTSFDTNNLQLTFTADFEKPGDKISFKVAIVNEGSLDAALKKVVVKGDDENSDAIQLSYDVKNSEDSVTFASDILSGAVAEKTTNVNASENLVKKNGTNIDKDYLYVTMEYLSTAEGVLVGEESTYTLSLYYEQV